MIIAHAARLRGDGESRIPVYVHDAGYDEAPLTWDLPEHLDQAQILVRVLNDRVMYRDPAPEPPRRGRPRKHSADRFECADPTTWGPRTGNCHSMTGNMATSASCPGAACTGFDIEHTYRFAKHGLGWDKAALRYPGQVQRWTWLIIAAVTMLRLARPAAEDHRQRWERRRPRGKLTPGRVRRDFCRLAALAGTPARPQKNTMPGPGRPKGRTSTPATRYPAITKAA